MEISLCLLRQTSIGFWWWIDIVVSSLKVHQHRYPSRSWKNWLSRSSVVIWYPAPKNVFSIASSVTQPSSILKQLCIENWNHTSFNLYKFGSTPCCKSSIAASHLKYGPGISNVVGWFASNTLPLLYKTEKTSYNNTC